MKDNNYSTVEGILYNLPKLKVEIDNLKLDLEEAQEVVGITGASGNEKAGSATYAFSSVVENEVVQRERNMEQRTQAILKEIQKKERQLKRVENILSILTEYELQLIEMRYFKRYSIGRICEVMELTEDGFNKRRKRLIKERLLKERLIPLFFL